MGKSLLLEKTRKASDILLEYFRPLLQGVPPEITEDRLMHVLSVPIGIWNAMSFEDAGRKGTMKLIFDCFNDLPREEQSGCDQAVFFWIRRKVELFPSEIWCIRSVKLRTTAEGEKRLRVLVSLPSEMEHLAPRDWVRIIPGGKANSKPL